MTVRAERARRSQCTSQQTNKWVNQQVGEQTSGVNKQVGESRGGPLQQWVDEVRNV